MRALLSQPSARTRDYVAWLNGTPVGAIEAFVGSKCAGIHGLTVTERYQGRGIASGLMSVPASIFETGCGAHRTACIDEDRGCMCAGDSMKWRGSGTGIGASSATADSIRDGALCRYGPRLRWPTSMPASRSTQSAWAASLISPIAIS